MHINPLVGLWKLCSFVMEDELGNKQFSLGENPIGYINYLPNGFMMVHMGKKQRPMLTAQSIFDVKLSEELLEMVRSYGGYCGRYEIKGNVVYHHIELSSFSNWTGKTIHRQFMIKDQYLNLNDHIEANGKKFMFVAVWQKVD